MRSSKTHNSLTGNTKISRKNIPDLNEHPAQAHGYSLRLDQTRMKASVLPQHYITLKRKRTAKKSLITRKINQISQLITEQGSRTKTLYLRHKLNDVIRETEIINEEMISMSDEPSIETDPRRMEDVTFNVDTCNSDIQRYIDFTKDEPPSYNRSITSWNERCQSEDGKSDIEKERSENKYVEHVQENLPNLANRLKGLTLQGTKQEEENVHRDNTCPPELKGQWYLDREKKKKMKQLNQRYNV